MDGDGDDEVDEDEDDEEEEEEEEVNDADDDDDDENVDGCCSRRDDRAVASVLMLRQWQTVERWMFRLWMLLPVRAK